MPRNTVRPVLTDLSPQSLQDHYFPRKNWLPQLTGQEYQVDGATMTHIPIKHILVFASCDRCGAAVEQGHWRNHINYHMNVTGT